MPSGPSVPIEPYLNCSSIVSKCCASSRFRLYHAPKPTTAASTTTTSRIFSQAGQRLGCGARPLMTTLLSPRLGHRAVEPGQGQKRPLQHGQRQVDVPEERRELAGVEEEEEHHAPEPGHHREQ